MNEMKARISAAIDECRQRRAKFGNRGIAESIDFADAALKVMRTPTPKMVEAGATAICLSLEVTTESWRDHIDEAEVAFMRAIDEALK